MLCRWYKRLSSLDKGCIRRIKSRRCIKDFKNYIYELYYIGILVLKLMWIY